MKLLNREIEKRVIIKLDKSIRADKSSGTMLFGLQNDYPQLIEKLILGSQTAKACVGIYSKFISGIGFENSEIGKINVGIDSKGRSISLDRMRREISISLAMFNGARIHCNENLDKKIGSTKLVPFKNCRYSREDANGYCGKILVHPNWAKEPELNEGKSFNSSDISAYYNFNIDAIADNIKDSGGIDNDGKFKGFKGQIYSLDFDNSYLYPLSPFDSVYLDMDTENQIQLFKNRQIRDGFTDKALILIDPVDDDKERNKTVEKIQKMMGPDGGNVVVLEASFDKDTGEIVSNSGFKVEKISTTINDKLFENWEKSLANNIRKSISGLPAVLIDYEQGKLSQASGQMIVEAINYYNGLTQGLRENLSEAIKEIYSNFNDPVLAQNSDWRIKPFTIEGVS